MKYWFNYFLRLIVKFALHLFYHKIVVDGKKHIPKDKAVIIVSNHQNALIDPLMIATHTRLEPHFLTRASAFRNPFFAKLLDYIRMIPIYRVRDGVKNMEKNQETFDKSIHVLLGKGSMLIFGEGSHSTLRNLRPLKKGFARIAFQTLEKNPDLDLVILPVGINYSNHFHSGSKVRISFGEYIEAKMHYPNFDSLIKTTHQALEKLVVNIPDENYENLLHQLIDHKVDLTSKIAVDQFIEAKQPQNKLSKPTYLRNKLMKLFHLPLYWTWLRISNKIKDATFIATFKFIIGLVGLPAWYFTLILASIALGHKDWAFTYLLLAVIFLLTNKNPQK
ncbi:lysophospholipid acyltransferase family protein [Belliella kenyensis]|uniref:Lysophospholipid acyltransferase family protein n=1 Tax=Belliella kenyensis TaxID=1472724 RepID=A0ABV8EJV2_9BACT|nr:lysophospholipid acyltransferase family protein [Belliella kenyensis]MCH7403204.1 lysophospholipid acyltransferase family protein [Belliella kenyensis]MDN3604815.1 lysophospholipid acyltransferase family protein [Belliella kenyensis]